MGYFFILSAVGLLWIHNYQLIISNPYWFLTYLVGIGWWTAGFSCLEYFEKYIENYNPKKKD
jgi:hypothetical protein